MVFRSLTIFLLYLLATVNTNTSGTGTFKSDELDINIDVSNLVAEFDEKINYSLKVKDNDVNVQKIEKILPDLDDNKFFDLKVISEKADIKKFEIIEIKDAHNPNKTKKILLIEYKLKRNSIINFDEISSSRDQFVTDIDFCICFKTKDFQVVKNKIFLRDVPFSNIDNADENLKLKINLFNLPKNADIKKIDIAKSDNYNADGGATDVTPPPVGNQMNNNYNNNNNFNMQNRNQNRHQNHHKFRVSDAENNNNKNNKNNGNNLKNDKYSFKYDDTFHKDSVAFLSINLTLVNKSDLIGNSTENAFSALPLKANKIENLKINHNKIKEIREIGLNNTNSTYLAKELKQKKNKKKKKNIEEYFNDIFIDNFRILMN